jgi:hypothetical protein
VGFVVGKIAMGQFFLRVLHFDYVNYYSINAPFLHTSTASGTMDTLAASVPSDPVSLHGKNKKGNKLIDTYY